MSEYDGENAAEVKQFVKQAVRLPRTDLEAIRRNGPDSSGFHVLRVPVQELANGGDNARADTKALHEYIQRLASEAIAARPKEERNVNSRVGRRDCLPDG